MSGWDILGLKSCTSLKPLPPAGLTDEWVPADGRGGKRGLMIGSHSSQTRWALWSSHTAQWQTGRAADTRLAKWTFHHRCAAVVQFGCSTSEVGSVTAKAGLFTLPRWGGRSQMLAFHTCCFHCAHPPHWVLFFNDAHFVRRKCPSLHFHAVLKPSSVF